MKRFQSVRLLILGLAAMVLDVTTGTAGGPYQFFSVAPCRIVDTRGPTGATGGPSLTAGMTRNFPITGLCNVPSTAKAAVLNVTFVGPTTDGFLVIWPYNTPAPAVSTVNAAAGEPAIGNGAIVALTADPTYNVSVTFGTAVPGTAHVILDVTGYFQ